ncbi:alpha/beta hydrolase-fold protein [Acidaminobacter sp.]|uniref:alpha/beta hydrolase-fold protein n=1 Tax=Acidaminobacter sp. TaxID=1872102 RepID=UPI00256D3C19|nr:PHB depolymerase family esterase [Acidaminobacter sp.]MDK9712040.1 alpha/beta hydrolase-fold protein [Acidaminobacter sp.]
MKRRFWSFLMICVIAVSLVSIPNLANSTIPAFPTNFEEVTNQLDLLDPMRLPYTGLYEQTVTIGNLTRTFKAYIPESGVHCASSVFILPPNGETAADFIEDSGWMEIADKNGFYLFVPEPFEGEWKQDGTEVDYIKAVVAETAKRVYYNPYPGNMYILGYQEGATVAQQAAMRTPNSWAGLATFGEINVTETFMMETAGLASNDPQVALSEVPVPVWMIANKLNDSASATLAYWMAANNVSDQAYTLDDTRVYMPELTTVDRMIDAQPVAKVQFTKKNTVKYDPEFNEQVWDEFLSKVGRFAGITNTNLRALLGEEGAGMVGQSLVVDGYKRTWYEYVPTSAQSNPDQPLPVVVVYHGGSQTSASYIDYLQWYKIAEERNFIVVMPQGYPMKRNGIPHPSWNVAAVPTAPDDIEFTKSMIENVESRYSVDQGKVYCTGQSMGSMMSLRAAMALPDIFTASGSTSGVIINPAMYELTDVNTDYEVPVWIIMGQNDIGGGSLTQNAAAKTTVEYWIERNQTIAVDQGSYYKNGAYNHFMFVNDNNTPMVRYSVVDQKGHLCLPSEAWMLWDEFFSKYNRNENGDIEFEGRAAN